MHVEYINHNDIITNKQKDWLRVNIYSEHNCILSMMWLKHSVVSINRSSYLCFLKGGEKGGTRKSRKLQRVILWGLYRKRRSVVKGGGGEVERFYRLTSVSSGLSLSLCHEVPSSKMFSKLAFLLSYFPNERVWPMYLYFTTKTQKIIFHKGSSSSFVYQAQFHNDSWLLCHHPVLAGPLTEARSPQRGPRAPQPASAQVPHTQCYQAMCHVDPHVAYYPRRFPRLDYSIKNENVTFMPTSMPNWKKKKVTLKLSSHQ